MFDRIKLGNFMGKMDAINCESFMPGVVLGIRKIGKLKGLVYGLENIL